MRRRISITTMLFERYVCLLVPFLLLLRKVSPTMSVEATSSSLQVLVTILPHSSQHACFFAATDEECCLGIYKASISLYEAGILDPTIFSESQADCLSDLALVPSLPSLPGTLANYSWTVADTTTKKEADGAVVEQYLYRNRNLGRVENESSPFLLESTLSSSASLNSQLSLNGGMHRLWYQHLSLQEGELTLNDDDRSMNVYVFWTIPQGIFVDLDDPVESLVLSWSSSLEQQPVHSANYTIHSAVICDIEQPAFVSGQHVVVMEIPGVSPPLSPSISITAKLHLRYPFPSSTKEQWIDLPPPQVVLVNLRPNLSDGGDDDGDDGGGAKYHIYHSQTTMTNGGMERIRVAAGNDEDYDFVMYTTLSACLLGVYWMLRDISYVSHWDDTG